MSDPEIQRPPGIVLFYRWVWKFWKARRFQRFVDAVKPTANSTLLDIGGYPTDWWGHGTVLTHVDVLNLEPVPVGTPPQDSPVLRSIRGDARRLDLPDASYEIVFSNSVIEHVGGIEDQLAFASEARRVGHKLWIQTPAKGCPVEPHYLGLFIHWFPARWHVCMARWTSLRGLTGAAKPAELRAIAAATRLLTKREMQRLFPDCEIWTERLFWVFPKSHVAVRNTDG